ncbi:MAG: hypothetical protein JSR96_03880 [Proteobacteria bacterium]|nr:hypothetical protein [Pseudomonadota bacterium]
MARVRSAYSVAALCCALLATPLMAESAAPSLAGVSVACQDAYRAMVLCRDQAFAAGAPESMRSEWDKRIADAVKMFRANRGVGGVEKTCKDIAANRECG